MAVILWKYLIFAALKRQEFKCFPDLWPEGLLQNPASTPKSLLNILVCCMAIEKLQQSLLLGGIRVLYNQIRARQTLQESFLKKCIYSVYFC